MEESLLYPVNNKYRVSNQITGFWKFIFDKDDNGEDKNYQNGFDTKIELPVPASFNDFFTNREDRNYTGTFWYEKDVFLSKKENKRLILRFSGAVHQAIVYLNGKKVKDHRGGFLPFEIDITNNIKHNEINKIVVKMNNELSHTTLPAGETKILQNGVKKANPYFDFFNYSGLIRPVWIMEVPETKIIDVNTKTELVNNKAILNYEVFCNTKENVKVNVSLYNEESKKVAESSEIKGKLLVDNPHLWEVRNAYLYNMKIELIKNNEVIDEYCLNIGLRTVEIKEHKILLNGHEVYLKGYGRHEDTDFYGRGYNPAAIKKDFELMKWTNANSFRTSHYPYSEEIYDLADKEGFLIIDEVPAVGFMQSTQNFLTAGVGAKVKSFFDNEDIGKLQQNHLSDINDLIKRDKNHPCVIAWSLFNEPDTSTASAKKYFEPIFKEAHKLDIQNRPRTFTLILKDTPEISKCYEFADFLCLNRYYGWYLYSADELSYGMEKFDEELKKWHEVAPNKPIVITEFGADAIKGNNKIPGTMWSEDYMLECIKDCNEIFDKYDFVCGEQVWNFADFETSESLFRVDGNKKGVFTRDRQPKRLAYYLKDRWQQLS